MRQQGNNVLLMLESNDSEKENELTPVDDVRKVRERLSEEAGHDIRRLAEEAHRITERLRKKLGLDQKTN